MCIYKSFETICLSIVLSLSYQMFPQISLTCFTIKFHQIKMHKNIFLKSMDVIYNDVRT